MLKKAVFQKVLATAGCACCFGLLGLVQSTWGFLGFSYALRWASQLIIMSYLLISGLSKALQRLEHGKAYIHLSHQIIFKSLFFKAFKWDSLSTCLTSSQGISVNSSSGSIWRKNNLGLFSHPGQQHITAKRKQKDFPFSNLISSVMQLVEYIWKHQTLKSQTFCKPVLAGLIWVCRDLGSLCWGNHVRCWWFLTAIRGFPFLF